MKLRFTLMSIAAVCALVSCSRQRNPDAFRVWGIDVSKHQADVDWGRLCKEERPHFVFLKATEGTLIVDPKYDRHACDLDRNGILRGAYHFFGHRTSGKEQAEQFIKTAKLGKGNLWPVLDIEKNRLMTDPKRSVREARAFCKRVKREYGVYPIIYCSHHFYHKYLKKDFPARRYVLWIADYRDEPSDLRWTFWQHTETHQIKGIKGCVDRNVFDGRPKDLEKYILR